MSSFTVEQRLEIGSSHKTRYFQMNPISGLMGSSTNEIVAIGVMQILVWLRKHSNI